jgi:hypothetical protein
MALWVEVQEIQHTRRLLAARKRAGRHYVCLDVLTCNTREIEAPPLDDLPAPAPVQRQHREHDDADADDECHVVGERRAAKVVHHEPC